MLGSGPLGGNPGWTRTPPPAGRGKKRFVTKGIKIGSYVLISYRVPSKVGQAEDAAEYEGKIVDKRVGSDDRESYVELKDCLRLNARGQVVARDKSKKLFDAYIEECRITEKRDSIPEIVVEEAPLPEAIDRTGYGGHSADGVLGPVPASPEMTASSGMFSPGMGMPFGMGMPGMMHMGMGMGPGMMPMGMMHMGMMPMGMGAPGMMPMGMGGMGMPMMPGCFPTTPVPEAKAEDATGRARSRSRDRSWTGAEHTSQ
mmetsp:Transcript_9726/g.21773  ORF Transcript_9726/g.21773 Transcript_9726/m.21773 type:complete len:257 (-) Transcript_9726:14-784(-)